MRTPITAVSFEHTVELREVHRICVPVHVRHDVMSRALRLSGAASAARRWAIEHDAQISDPVVYRRSDGAEGVQFCVQVASGPERVPTPFDWVWGQRWRVWLDRLRSYDRPNLSAAVIPLSAGDRTGS